MFLIETEKLQLKLEIVPVESLTLHEKIIPSLANKLILEFKNLANLQNPIIVDENNIVLDGNHRAFVSRELKFKYIPVCKIDYFNETAMLRYWFRLLGNIQDMDLLRAAIEDMGGHLQEVKDREELTRALECDQLCCGIQCDNFHASFRFPKDLVYDAVRAYDILEEIQEILIKKGVELKYIPCDKVHENEFCNTLESGKVVIWTPQITKQMVVEAVKEKKVFAPKSTRHIIPARPLNVNVPNNWFTEDLSLEEMNKRFSEFLKRKGLRRFGPGQVIDGRYYEEELFVFFEKNKLYTID